MDDEETELDWASAKAPSLDDIADLADAAREALPAPFDYPAKEILIRIADLPDEEMVADLELASPMELTGLYDGIPLTEKSVSDQPEQPDMIWLFRRPILEEWSERVDVSLGELVTHVLVHELAHHFGWSDEDIANIDRWWE